jgi:hypothetical protein
MISKVVGLWMGLLFVGIVTQADSGPCHPNPHGRLAEVGRKCFGQGYSSAFAMLPVQSNQSQKD